jgi:hypothetical protein
MDRIYSTLQSQLNTTILNELLRQWFSWHRDKWVEINEIIQIDGSNNFSLSDLFTQALISTKAALLSWSKFVFPILVFLLKIMLHLLFFTLELLKFCYRLSRPYLSRAYDKCELAWDLLSDKTKMIIIFSIVALVLLFLVSRWITSIPFVKGLIKGYNNFKQTLVGKYQNFIRNIQHKSLLLAQTVPHLLFGGIIFLMHWFNLNFEYFVSLSTQMVPLQSSSTGQIRELEPIGKYILFPFAIGFPIISSLYHSITTEYFMSDYWITCSMPKLNDNWVSKNEKRFANFYKLQYRLRFFGEELNLPQTGESSAQKPRSITITQLFNNNTFLTTLSQSLIDYSNYWITLACFSCLWSLPLTGHVIDYSFQHYHYLPVCLLGWLLNPLTLGGNSVVTLLRPALKLAQYIPLLNLLILTPKLQLPQLSSLSEHTPYNLQTPPDSYENHALFRWFEMALNLPVVPRFLKAAILQNLHESGPLLLACSIGLVTPTFISQILLLIVCFLRPALASLGHATNLRQILQFQQSQQQLLRDPAKTESSQEKETKSEPKELTLSPSQFISLREQQIHIMKRLAIYLLIFSGNYFVKSVASITSLTTLPLTTQILLGGLLYFQTPLFPMSLFQAALQPMIRRSFLALHFNMENINTAQPFLVQNKPSAWDKLFAPSIISPQNTLTSTNPQDLTNTQSGAFFAPTPTTSASLLGLELNSPTQSHLHFTSLKFQAGISSTVIATKNITISPIVSAMCWNRINSRDMSMVDDNSEDEDEDKDNIENDTQNTHPVNTLNPEQPSTPHRSLNPLEEKKDQADELTIKSSESLDPRNLLSPTAQ